LLADEELRGLAEVSGLRLGLRPDALAAERYLLYAACSRPEEQLVLSWHVADDDGEAMSRSLFVDDVCDLFAESLASGRSRRALGASRRLATRRRAAGGGPAPSGEPLGDPRLLERLRGHVWSASSLERWIGCPVAWFVQRMLNPDAFDPEPEPLARGALAHAALRDTLDALRRETGTARLTVAVLGRARELLARSLESTRPSTSCPSLPSAAWPCGGGCGWISSAT